MKRIICLLICGVMLLTDLLALNFSTITLMLICAVISMSVFLIGRKKGGAA